MTAERWKPDKRLFALWLASEPGHPGRPKLLSFVIHAEIKIPPRMVTYRVDCVDVLDTMIRENRAEFGDQGDDFAICAEVQGDTLCVVDYRRGPLLDTCANFDDLAVICPELASGLKHDGITHYLHVDSESGHSNRKMIP